MADKPEPVVIDGSDGVWARVRSYDVSIWPEDLVNSPDSCLDADTWKITVEYRGFGKFAVCRAVRKCLGRNGTWDYESIPSERDVDWLPAHRFSLDEAIALAREWAPKVTVNGMTALEVLARHRQRHPDGDCGA